MDTDVVWSTWTEGIEGADQLFDGELSRLIILVAPFPIYNTMDCFRNVNADGDHLLRLLLRANVFNIYSEFEFYDLCISSYHTLVSLTVERYGKVKRRDNCSRLNVRSSLTSFSSQPFWNLAKFIDDREKSNRRAHED